MKNQWAASLVLALAAAATCASAQDVVIDDFTTGNYQSSPYIWGPTHTSTQTGKMMGGSRITNMYICPTTAKCPTYNPYNQPSSYGFVPATSTQPAAMVQSAGFYAGPRIDMGYGFGAYMSENFAAHKKIRLRFKGLSQTLNFNIQLFTGTSWAQGGCNIGTYPAEFSVELPLSDFVTTKGFDMTNVNLINFIFQDGSYIGGVNFAIQSIELTDTTATGTVISCHY